MTTHPLSVGLGFPSCSAALPYRTTFDPTTGGFVRGPPVVEDQDQNRDEKCQVEDILPRQVLPRSQPPSPRSHSWWRRVLLLHDHGLHRRCGPTVVTSSTHCRSEICSIALLSVMRSVGRRRICYHNPIARSSVGEGRRENALEALKTVDDQHVKNCS